MAQLSVLAIWRRLEALPGGNRLFTWLICLWAPYFGSIRPRFEALAPGRAVVTLRNRRSVQNHIKSVHAIAICNLAEMAAGVMTEATVPPTHRWIPKGMTVEYLRRADTKLTAEAVIDAAMPFGAAQDLHVPVSVRDIQGQEVFRAVITMWVSPRKSS